MKYKNEEGNWEDIVLKVGDTLPVGSILPFGGANAPEGWYICDGSEKNRTNDAELFNAIGTAYGLGNGTTTFNLPDYRGKVPVGLDITQGEFDSLGETGGEKTHTLTINEMPSHNHGLDYSIVTFADSGTVITATSNENGDTKNGYYYMAQSQGGGLAHNILQPYIVTNYIIKATNSVGIVGNVFNVESTSTQDTYSANYINTQLNELKDKPDIYSGTSAPTNDIGKDGDIYLQVEQG